MDGKGRIQVNRGKKLLQYRLIINLSNSEYNLNMLILIAKIVGGTVRISPASQKRGEAISRAQKSNVIWIIDKKEEVEKAIKIFESYPPLTSKKICDLAFLNFCLSGIPVDQFEIYRNLKFDLQLTIPSFYTLLPSSFPASKEEGDNFCALQGEVTNIPNYFKP
jgi:hypothetical protein